MDESRIAQLVKDELAGRPELLRAPYKARVAAGAHPLTGHCYVGSEAMWHLLGGRGAGWKPVSVRYGGSTHWWLEHMDGRRLDVTAEQFPCDPPYAKGRGRGFLTCQPSRRARVILDIVKEKLDSPT